MRHLDLFTGIGGFAFAAQVVWGDDYELVATCEMNEFCQKVIHKHWPGTPNHPDIKTMNGEKYAGTVELITGGFPCQPYSLAGKRKGADDDRALWPEMLRVISEVRPNWVLAENVTGIIHMELDKVLSGLGGAGYQTEVFNIPAAGVDAKHRRERIWVVGNATIQHGECAKDRRVEGELFPETRRAEITDQIDRSGGNASCDVAYASSKGRNTTRGAGEAIPEPGTQQRPAGCGKAMADTITERLQGQRETGTAPATVDRSGNGRNTCQWAIEPAVGRVAHGIPSRVDRLRGLGNAIVPQVAMAIFQAIKESEML